MTREQLKRDRENLYYEQASDNLTGNCFIVNEFDYDCEAIKKIMNESGLDFEQAVKEHFGDREPWEGYLFEIKRKIEKEQSDE